MAITELESSIEPQDNTERKPILEQLLIPFTGK